MKALEEYNIQEDGWFFYKSKLCGVACALDYPHTTPLSSRINELAQSYFNQWQFVIRTYEKLYLLLEELNAVQDKPTTGNTISQYDICSMEKEKEFRDYAYLLVISLKTFLDLFACLIEITLMQQVTDEHKMTDFNRLKKSLRVQEYNKLLNAFNCYTDPNSHRWITLLSEIRNKIVHRGYHIKPRFGFSKSDDITVIVYKGNDVYYDVKELQIGIFFNSFMTEFPKIENEVSELIEEIIKEKIEFPIEVSYKYSELMTAFAIKEILQ